MAKTHGDELVVVVARDSTIEAVKGKPPVFSEQERLQTVASVPTVDKVVLGNPGSKYDIIEQEHPDVLCLGYDQTFFLDDLGHELEMRGLYPLIIRLPAFQPEVYKSSLLKSKLPTNNF